jgi:transcriptional regulator with XRE-family HTH domain
LTTEAENLPDDDAQPRLFDHARFGVWLKGWMTSEGVTLKRLTERSGLSYGTIQALASGTPPRQSADASKRPGAAPRTRAVSRQRSHGINVFAALAHALGLPVSYVVARGGLDDEADRWALFTRTELRTLAALLGGDDVADFDALLRDAADRERSEIKETA